jgi:CheY-like chemotaxis protein
MNPEPVQVLLADDDKDDCLFFEEALGELPLSARLTTVHNGEQLMQLLTSQPEQLPHVLFLDLNIPRKNGLECLSEIRRNKKLKPLFVIIISTSSEESIVNKLYKNGAQYYIRKPAEFSQLKKVIQQALTLIAESRYAGRVKTFEQTSKEKFVLTGDSNN